MNWINIKHQLPNESVESLLLWDNDEQGVRIGRYSLGRFYLSGGIVPLDPSEITHYCILTKPLNLAGTDTFSKESLNEIKAGLLVINGTKSEVQRSMIHTQLRENHDFYISDFLPKHKDLVTRYIRAKDMEPRHLDELVEAGIIKINENL